MASGGVQSRNCDLGLTRVDLGRLICMFVRGVESKSITLPVSMDCDMAAGLGETGVRKAMPELGDLVGEWKGSFAS
jgi:hypothetical protein